MQRELLGQANEIDKKIKRLEAEINFLEWQAGHTFVKALRPKQQNHKNFYCSNRVIDTVGSVIYLDGFECKELAKIKKSEVEKLKEEYTQLDLK